MPSQTHKSTNALIGSVGVGRVEGQCIGIVGSGLCDAVAIEGDLLVERVIGSRNQEGISAIGCPIQEVFDSAKQLYVVEFLVGNLDVLNAIRQRILATRIEGRQQGQTHTASITSGIIQTQEPVGDFVAQSPRQTDFFGKQRHKTTAFLLGQRMEITTAQSPFYPKRTDPIQGNTTAENSRKTIEIGINVLVGIRIIVGNDAVFEMGVPSRSFEGEHARGVGIEFFEVIQVGGIRSFGV